MFKRKTPHADTISNGDKTKIKPLKSPFGQDEKEWRVEKNKMLSSSPMLDLEIDAETYCRMAFDEYGEAIRIDKTDIGLYKKRIEANKFLPEVQKANSDWFNERLAFQDYSCILQYDSGDRQIYYEMAKIARRLNDFKKVYKLGIRDPEVILVVFRQLLEKESTAKALRFIDKAIAQNPNSPELYAARAGVFLLYRNRKIEGIRDYSKVILLSEGLEPKPQCYYDVIDTLDILLNYSYKYADKQVEYHAKS
jgi:tetratricopeptide (TPR) repeat protein